MRSVLRRWWRAIRAWWSARQEFRRSLCTWCGQPLWHGDRPTVRTAVGRRRVHPGCLQPADADEYAGSLW